VCGIEGGDFGSVVGVALKEGLLEAGVVFRREFENGEDLSVTLDRAIPVVDRVGWEECAAGGESGLDEVADNTLGDRLVGEGGDSEPDHAGTGAGWRTIQPPPTTLSPS